MISAEGPHIDAVRSGRSACNSSFSDLSVFISHDQFVSTAVPSQCTRFRTEDRQKHPRIDSKLQQGTGACMEVEALAWWCQYQPSRHQLEVDTLSISVPNKHPNTLYYPSQYDQHQGARESRDPGATGLASSQKPMPDVHAARNCQPVS